MSAPSLDDLRAAVAASRFGARGDHDLNSGYAAAAPLRAAAVLCAVALGPAGPSIVLTVRPETMRAHAGQIALPGGKIDPGDATPVDAALREAHEEVGLPPERVEVLGALPVYATRTGFAVTPVIGVIDGPFVPTPDPREVAEVFAAPYPWLMDLSRYQRVTRRFGGAERAFWAAPWGRHMIWGATAGILRGLAVAVAETRADRSAA